MLIAHRMRYFGSSTVCFRVRITERSGGSTGSTLYASQSPRDSSMTGTCLEPGCFVTM